MNVTTWRELLRKYIRHVGVCEGTAFISDYYRNLGGFYGTANFTDEEWATLEELLEEVLEGGGK